MRVRCGGESHRGRAIDLRDRSVDPSALLAAIRSPDDGVVAAPSPGPVHEFVGRLGPGTDCPLRRCLAAAARSRGVASPFDDAIAQVDAALAAIETEPVDLAALRRRVAETGADVARLRERVAHLRGRIGARRDAGLADADAAVELREAITALSEAETAELAAEQALAAGERSARRARDARERRLSLADRRDNRARRARRWLAAHEASRFARALAALPVASSAGANPVDYDGDPLHAAMAAARLASVRAPLVVVDGPFPSAVAARAALDAPVVLV
ncbi:MAG: hypothetical protein ABEJ67_05485 [Halanaeroarchaeum sp.]